MVFADAPWSPNIRVSTEIAWDTVDQGESSFDVYGNEIYTICNTAQRGKDPNAPFAYSLESTPNFIQLPFVDDPSGTMWLTDPIIEVDDSGHVHLILQFDMNFMNHYLSRDGGLTWDEGTQVNTFNGMDKPWWVFKENEIYVVWQQIFGSDGVFLAKSTDWGKTFEDNKIWDKTGITGLVMDEEGNLHLVLVAGSDAGIFYRKSTDKGLTWTPEQRLGDVVYDASYGDRAPINSIAASGNYVFITWVDNRADGSWNVNGIRSSDGGNSWGQEFIVNDDSQGGQCKGYVHFDCYGGLHFQYYHTPSWPTDSSSSLFSVRYRYSADGGATFEPSIRLTDAEWTSHADFMGEYHMLRSDSQYVYSVWTDGRNPKNNDLYFSKALIEDIVSIKDNPIKFSKNSHKIITISKLINKNILITIEPSLDPITINAYDVSGRMLKNIYKGKTTSTLSLKLQNSELPSGLIFLRASSRNISEVRQIFNVK